MPFSMPLFLGMLVLGPRAGKKEMLVAGHLHHFLNGAAFGLIYTLLLGAPAWWWGVIWGLLIELGMMTMPPILVMGVGVFGWKRGYGIFAVSLTAHLVFGLVLGLLVPLLVWSDVPIWQLAGW